LIYNTFYLNDANCRHATKNPTDQRDRSPRRFQRPRAAVCLAAPAPTDRKNRLFDFYL